MAKSGFGLLEKKRFRWFNKEGGLLGSILSKDPIRRVYCSAEGMVRRPASVGPPSAAHRPGGSEAFDAGSRGLGPMVSNGLFLAGLMQFRSVGLICPAKVLDSSFSVEPTLVYVYYLDFFLFTRS